MGIPEQDRNKLSGDRRFSRLLQTAQAIPDTMTVRGTALTIVLERINAPQGSMTITGAVAGGEITLNEVSVNSSAPTVYGKHPGYLESIRSYSPEAIR